MPTAVDTASAVAVDAAAVLAVVVGDGAGAVAASSLPQQLVAVASKRSAACTLAKKKLVFENYFYLFLELPKVVTIERIIGENF